MFQKVTADTELVPSSRDCSGDARSAATAQQSPWDTLVVQQTSSANARTAIATAPDQRSRAAFDNSVPVKGDNKVAHVGKREEREDVLHGSHSRKIAKTKITIRLKGNYPETTRCSSHKTRFLLRV